MSDPLCASTPDTIALAEAVESRFLTLCEGWLHKRGVKISVPKSIDGDLLRWRQMCVRHKKGDRRNTVSEINSTKAIAQWTVTMNCELRGQPDKQMSWTT